MKKFTKISLIVAGILAALGVVLMGISMVFGGYRNIRNAMRSGEVLDTFEQVAERTGVQISFPDGGWGINLSSAKNGREDRLVINGEEIGMQDASYEFSTEEVQDMAISLGAGEFEIRKGNVDQIAMELQGVGSWDYSVSGGTLSLDMKSTGGILLGDGPKNVIKCVIEIPQNYNPEQIALDLGAGQVTLSDLEVENLSLSVGAGQIICKNVRSRNADIDVAIGECQFQGEVKEDMEINCATGQVVARLTGREEDYNYELSCALGSIRIGKINLSGFGGSKSMDNDSDRNMTIDCSTGNVEVDFEE